jgi:hypothetical protein
MTKNTRSRSALLLAIVLALAVLEGEPPVDAQGRGTISGVVTHVADGDTLDITANGQTYTIRLDGIDAPEGGRQRLPSWIAIATAGRLPGSSSLAVISARRWSGRLAALEQEARQQRRGLWADRSAQPPWEYRSNRGAPPKVTPPPPSPAAPLSAGPYHGNVSSRVYHAPGCPDYNFPNCTHVFSSRREAETAGYRPHDTCVVGRQ